MIKSTLKQILLIAVVYISSITLLSLSGCGDKPQVKETTTASTKGTINVTNGAFNLTYDIGEFEYKEHTYMSCQVRDGVSIAHAGHCKCNKKK